MTDPLGDGGIVSCEYALLEINAAKLNTRTSQSVDSGHITENLDPSLLLNLRVQRMS